MTVERWTRLTELFHAALERGGEERARFLDDACADDPSLRAEVERLIAAHERAGPFIETPAIACEARKLASGSAKEPGLASASASPITRAANR